MTGFPGVKEANVYGVAVPGLEGRAGMAALVVDGDLDLDGFARHVTTTLPAFSRPIFLRITPELETTSTFKQRKLDLVKEGFDPTKIGDPVFMFDAAHQTYAKLEAAQYPRICSGEVKL